MELQAPQQQAEAAAACKGNRREVERLCRLCATITTHPNQRVDIFAVDGLRIKIETCLPVHVSKESLLPDTLCTTCNDKVCSFYTFRKRAMETLKILEDNFHVKESCFNKPTVIKPADITKSDKSTSTDQLLEENTQFEEWKEKKLATFHYDDESYTSKQENRRKLLNCALEMEKANEILDSAHAQRHNLVSYDSSSDDENTNSKNATATDYKDNLKTSFKNKLYFDDKVNDIISEIQERNKSTKRKLEVLFRDGPDDIGEGGHRVKIYKPSRSLNLQDLFPDTSAGSNRRKKRPPHKRTSALVATPISGRVLPQSLAPIPVPSVSAQSVTKQLEQLPQVCLLCDQQFPKGTLLAKHVFDTHGIDMAQVLSSEPIPEGMTRTLQANLQHLQANMQEYSTNVEIMEEKESVVVRPESPKTASAEKKKKLPELVKITDLKTKRESIDVKLENDAPPTLTASYVCPLCPASLTNKTDLYAHLRVRHAQHAKLICGLCLHIGTSVHTLQEHLDSCTKSHAVVGYFVCQVCKYAEDNQKSLENHILVHDFLLADCKKDGKIFDPSDFMDTNESMEPKFYSCTECGSSLQSFKEYSSHKRSEHSIFHCDLCNKSYGRNSHLWKHVNRVHKGHPSVTCQFCYKTSASKYHLLQHFNKIHTQKAGSISLSSTSSMTTPSTANVASKVKNGDVLSEFEEDDFLMKKFDPFDFQSVRQSFMRAEMEAKKGNAYNTHNQSQLSISNQAFDHEPTNKKAKHTSTQLRDLSSLKMPTVPPKELDSSSTIYTNIITNYTPPTNDGEYKCPKCSKAFHKRTLLKKHKKNCRPRLQKDLLTRCKSCSRIFKDRQSLAKHLVNYHSEYSCEMCDEKVASKCEIVSHIRFTHPGCHLICQDCGNVLRNNDLLRQHLQDHANSFVCQFCGDILPSKIKLKMHILSLHRKILSLSCGVCLKLFESQHILRDHVRMVHREALQPLTSCTVCGKNYGSKWKTYDHLNKSHGRVFRACKVCLEVFNNEQELQAHVDMHHSKGMKKYIPAEHVLPFAKLEKMDAEVDDVEHDEGEGDDSDDNDEPDLENEDLHEDDVTKDSLEYEPKSILEKHLVGAYRNNNQQNLHQSHQHNQQNQTNQQKQNGVPSIVTPSTINTSAHSQNTPNTPSTPRSKPHTEELINSSKRTVYVNSNDPSVCDICHKNWPAKKHLWQHYIRCHKQVAATVCGICLSTNKSYADLQRHLNSEHPTLLHGKGFGSNFICRICGRYHNASSKLKLHMAIHIKFDWSLLDNPQLTHTPIKQNDDEEQKIKFKVKIKPPQKHLSHAQVVQSHQKQNQEINDANFESMIEQVECSTNSSSSSESDDDGEGDGEGEGDNDGVEEEEGEGEDVEDDDEDNDDNDEEEEGEDEDEVEDDDVEDADTNEDEQNVSSQIEEEEEQVEDEQDIEEMSEGDEEDDEEDDDGDADGDNDEDEDDEEDEDLEEVPEIKPDVLHDMQQQLLIQQQLQQQQIAQQQMIIEQNDDNDDDVEDEENVEYEEHDEHEGDVDEDQEQEEYEEVVEEVVHQDDMTIYEQEEIIDGSYMHHNQYVIKHIVANSEDQELVEHLEGVEHLEDVEGLSQEIIYETGQVVTYEDDVACDVDDAVQSICYEEDDSCHDGNVAEEYEVQSTNAGIPGMNNQHEIQSAVDSIL